MKKKIYQPKPIVTFADIIFILVFSLLMIGSILGYIWDQAQRISAGRL
ncbi:MAG: hypothetical protein V3V33_04060 [Candidatus Lokiarchaeia archaeon]